AGHSGGPASSAAGNRRRHCDRPRGRGPRGPGRGPSPRARPMDRPMRRLTTTLVSLAAFLVAWKVLTVLTGTPDYILPAPEVVGERALRAIGSGLLWEHTAVTLSEILLGLAVGATSALTVGIALGTSGA